MTESVLETPSTDRQLAAQIAAGDSQALAAWFQQQQGPLYGFIYYRVGGDADLAADATQATFTLALQRLADFDPKRGEMQSWLRLLSRNVIRSTLAEHRRTQQLQLVWERLDATLKSAYERIDQELLPEEVLQREETRELVSMTLANLPPQYREVLQAKYLDDQTLAAIAELRSTTVDSIKSMLRRARSAFRECFLAMSNVGESQIEVYDA